MKYKSLSSPTTDYTSYSTALPQAPYVYCCTPATRLVPVEDFFLRQGAGQSDSPCLRSRFEELIRPQEASNQENQHSKPLNIVSPQERTLNPIISTF